MINLHQTKQYSHSTIFGRGCNFILANQSQFSDRIKRFPWHILIVSSVLAHADETITEVVCAIKLRWRNEELRMEFCLPTPVFERYSN